MTEETFVQQLEKLINDYHVPANVIGKLTTDFYQLSTERYDHGFKNGEEYEKKRIKLAMESKLSQMIGE